MCSSGQLMAVGVNQMHGTDHMYGRCEHARDCASVCVCVCVICIICEVEGF